MALDWTLISGWSVGFFVMGYCVWYLWNPIAKSFIRIFKAKQIRIVKDEIDEINLSGKKGDERIEAFLGNSILKIQNPIVIQIADEEIERDKVSYIKNKPFYDLADWIKEAEARGVSNQMAEFMLIKQGYKKSEIKRATKFNKKGGTNGIRKPKHITRELPTIDSGANSTTARESIARTGNEKSGDVEELAQRGNLPGGIDGSLGETERTHPESKQYFH